MVLIFRWFRQPKPRLLIGLNPFLKNYKTRLGKILSKHHHLKERGSKLLLN